MALIVQKFGGTSVGSIERIKNVAQRVARARAAGDEVVVVASAMSGETNRLLALGAQITKHPNERELDALVATGEQVSVALLAIALESIGVPARSFLGHQVRLRTDSGFTKARIKGLDADVLLGTIRDGRVPIVAGFQGVDDAGNVTTLGRGGSDTTAVAIAAALGQGVACEIYTDVEGVYTADPNVCKNAKKVGRISYEEMLELASLGAKVLQIRSVELAMKYAVPVHVRSSFSDAPGTWVVGEEASLESVVVAGVTSDKNEAKVTIRDVPDQPGRAASLFEALADARISVDMIIQNPSATAGTNKGTTDMTFTVPKGDVDKAREIAKKLFESQGIDVDGDVVKVSIVGLGMRSHAGVAAKMFRILADEGINIQAISTSEIKVSCLIHSKYHELAVRALHDGFGLGD
ncbi:aspartate kinase [Sandaracinus amylolyticus]|uniref:Aspartokinase n=1 Tax=Sandaracinus amylolyticus TaxID=927083 RepID=A0A0F6W439_9BACT|nr:aspartate kinase [Sandaracinus amylolyticus]AKF06911.1 Aspartokinase [Sandaracinus amylolyticus]